MLTKRIIACLDVKDGRVVKGVQFRNHVDMGGILELSQRYADEGVDELVFYDITASSDGRVVDKSWVNQIALTSWFSMTLPLAAMAVLLIKAGLTRLHGGLIFRFALLAAFAPLLMPRQF